MGLDMYAFTTPNDIPPVDFENWPKVSEEICYWRKHPNLHGWMERLYRDKGGAEESFDLVPVQLTAEDLDRLETDIAARGLPHTEGFFFGASDGTENADPEQIERTQQEAWDQRKH